MYGQAEDQPVRERRQSDYLADFRLVGQYGSEEKRNFKTRQRGRAQAHSGLCIIMQGHLPAIAS